MKNKIVIPILSTVAALLLAFGVSKISPIFSYMTDGSDSTNRISVGENKIQIVETFNPQPPTTGTNTYTKNVKVKNTGTVPCYIRVFMDFSSDKVRNESTVSADGTNYVTMAALKQNPPSGWTYIGDDDTLLGSYFYYTSAVDPNAETTELLKSFQTTFATDIDIENFDIYVYSESVQTLDKNGLEFTGSTPWKSAWQEFLGNA